MEKWQPKAEEVFGEALDLPREQRVAFLEAACRGMPEVRRAVEGLLAENDRLSGFLSESPYKEVEEAAGHVLDAKTRLGRYLILEALGSGGMGVVYRARDEKLERLVAIKMLSPGVLSGEEARRHFRREALALAKLNHPRIAAVYDVGEQDGADYIVMELVEGESLATKLRAGALEINEATAIAVQLAEALEEAHEHGVIHCDLKPANVMITPNGNAKVLDFGVAKMLALGTDATISLAEAGGLLGTPLYMSPEQALGRKVDARTDLWSLGVLYYESLAGRPPFEGGGSLGILHAIIEQPPAPLSEILPYVPPLAEQIVARALEKDCALRYQHAADLRTDLQRLIRDSSRSPWDALPSGQEQRDRGELQPLAPVLAQKPKPRKAYYAAAAVPADGVTRRRSRFGLALILLGVLIAAGILTSVHLWHHGRAAPIRSLAVLPLKNLSGDPAQEYFSDGMTEALIGRLSSIRSLRVISRTSVMAFKDTHMSMPEIAKRLHVDALVEGSVIRQGGRVRVHAQLIRGDTDEHFWSETYDRELGDTLSLQSEVAQSIARKVEVTVTGEEQKRLSEARPVAPEVYESYLRGQFVPRNNQAEIEESIAHFEEAIRKDPTFAPAYLGLAKAYESLSSIVVGGSPGELRPRVVATARKALELDPQLAEAHVLVAEIYQRQWQWSEAEAEYRIALDLKPSDAAAHLGLANWFLCKGRIEEALAWSRRARELDPIGTSGAEIGWILFLARRYDEAIREFHSVRAVHPNDAFAGWALGFVFITKGKPNEAIPILEKTAALMNHSPGSIELLATAYGQAGRRTEALRLIDELKRRRQSGYVPAGAFINPYLGLHDYDQAFVWFERAYQEQSSILQFLKVQPFFDPVRGDARFADLVHRVGLD